MSSKFNLIPALYIGVLICVEYSLCGVERTGIDIKLAKTHDLLLQEQARPSSDRMTAGTPCDRPLRGSFGASTCLISHP
uniref:hypothetical protein n=1 Tax=Scytonema sp. HK-05 TaxID=1137095 RepID=UPI0011613027|nr:hypothetical protein [Scytonema sp. HK-05]